MVMTIGDLAIDCADPEGLCCFYAAFTGWAKGELYGCPSLTAGNGLKILFMGCDSDYAPPVWPEKPGRQQKQVHLDFTVDDLPAALDRVLRLGAKRPAEQYGGEGFVTLLDLAGHPFCLCKRHLGNGFELYFRQRGFRSIPNPSINIDCPVSQNEGLRAFYAALTGWATDFHSAALIAGHGLVVHFMGCDFDYAPPVWPEEPGRQQKQMHFDLQVPDLPVAVEKALRLGAKRPAEQYGGEDFVTLLDPVGHPFCLCKAE
ncbi:MAG: hypothetical protein LBD02_08070 [Christensenellaceae bacterium]|jgi:predicted enzyme related to lactoylglutathione lyase|nr:hypothetical protein [Christensenellaceae bacterium]